MHPDWTMEVPPSARESRIIKLCKKRRLYVFLRLHRHLIFDEQMVDELDAMYSGVGRPPEDPVRLALAMVMQVAFGEADNEVPALTAADLRWRMVLELLDAAEEPAFSQGTVFNFRMRAIEHGFARRLLDKTVEVARSTKGFGYKKLRAVFDSSPLLGAGRVEDTINLLGRAVAQLAQVAAAQADRDLAELAEELLVPVATASSVKAMLDLDWRQPQARDDAVNILLEQFRRLSTWLEEEFSPHERERPPLSESLATVHRLIEQDTEPDPDPPESEGSERRRIRQNDKSGRDRQISLSDPQMRHGRKSKTKSFAGYKRHVAVDADVPGLIHEVVLLPANAREYDAAEPMLEGLESSGWEVTELQFDRGYLPATAIHERRQNGLKAVSKPPTPRQTGRLTKADFDVDFVARTITCPNGRTAAISSAGNAYFSKGGCRSCPLRTRCLPKSQQRKIRLHPQEEFYRQMAAELSTPEGRAARRERTVVEHALAHVGRIQGRQARFCGISKNTFDLERAAAVNNMYVLDQLLATAA